MLDYKIIEVKQSIFEDNDADAENAAVTYLKFHLAIYYIKVCSLQVIDISEYLGRDTQQINRPCSLE